MRASATSQPDVASLVNRVGVFMLVCSLACSPAIVAAVLVMVLMVGTTDLSPTTASASTADVESYMAMAKRYADDDTIGYSMSTRYHNPNMDCSSYVWYCLIDSGTCTTEQLGSTPFTTRTMAGLLERAGWQRLAYTGMDQLQRGDILVNEASHTEIYAGGGQDYAAHNDYDHVDGDSSGREVCLGSFWDDGWDCVMRPPASSGGTGDIQIPDEYGNGGYTVTEYDRFYGRWSSGTAQQRVAGVWGQKGKRWSDHIATIDGYYLVACTPKFGNVGDRVDFYLSDGTRIPCVIADQKRVTSSEGSNEWGHDNGQNVIEFEVESSWFQSHGNPGSSSWMPQWSGKRVASATNLGPAY